MFLISLGRGDIYIYNWDTARSIQAKPNGKNPILQTLPKPLNLVKTFNFLPEETLQTSTTAKQETALYHKIDSAIF